MHNGGNNFMTAHTRALSARLLTAGLTAATLTATLPAAAHAAPLSARPAGVLAAAAAAVEATPDQKLAVAVKFGRGEDSALLERADRDFVIGIWEGVKEDSAFHEVRVAAEQAFSTPPDPNDPDAVARACAEFIVTGVFAAYDRDIAREKDEADAKRQSDQARTAAAASIDVVADAAMLGGSDTEFIRLIWERVDGDAKWPKVKAAAVAARSGTAEEQRQFITAGLAAAAKQDVDDRIIADETKTAAEKAAALARAAKQLAANRIGLPVSDELLAMPDRDFVVEVWNHTADGTEVQAAAISAARTNDPAVWKAFIDTGIHQAKDRDIQIALQRKEAEDRRQVQEILARAERTGWRKLAEAARTALAGSPEDIDRFLRHGQYEVAQDGLAEDIREDVTLVYGYASNAIAPFTFTTSPTGAFTARGGYKSPDAAYNVGKMKIFRGDFNGDRIVDQAVLNAATDGTLTLDTFTTRPDGTTQAPLRSWTSKTFGSYDRMRLTSGDYNGDGRTDIAGFYNYADASIGLFTWIARPDGGFAIPTRSWFAPAQPTWGEIGRIKVFSGDFNKDGRTDVGAFYGYADTKVALLTWIANATGGFAAPTTAWSSGPTPYWGDINRMTITAGDFNGDGFGDVAGLYGYADGRLSVLTWTAKLGGGFNNAFSSWKSTATAWTAWDRIRLTAGDYNGDGRDDVALLTGYPDGSLTLNALTANASGGFGNPVQGWRSTTFGSYGRIHLPDDLS